MHEFFTPQHDHRLAAQLRREALAARPETKHLPARVALAVRRQQELPNSVDTSRSIPRQPIVYAIAAMLCAALALPVLWNHISPALSQAPSSAKSLATVAPTTVVESPALPKTIETPTAPASLAESADAHPPKASETELSLLTADAQAAVETLLATLPVDVDIESLVLP